MSAIFRSSLLLGVAVLSLAACSGNKGPGEIGTPDDIVVRNNGLPQSQQTQQAAAAPAAPQAGDFTSTVEQGEAIPAPQVASAEPLPDNSPAMKQAVAAQADANAPLPSTNTASAGQSATPAPTDVKPIDAIAPTTPVTAPSATPPTAEEMNAAQTSVPVTTPTPEGGVYPAADSMASATAPAPAPTTTTAPAPVAQSGPGPSAVPAGVAYPLDANAPYSPKAVAEATAAAGVAPSAAPATTSPAAPVTGNAGDPATIRAAQAALATKGGYTGAQNGTVDAAFLNALIMYQSQNNLPQGGLNEATLRNLDVIQ